jgi:hypothetical protein
MTSLRLRSTQSVPPSAALRAVVAADIATVSTGGPSLMEIGFDDEVSGRSMDFRPDLPLVLHW